MEEKEIRFYKALDNYINQKSNDWKEYSQQGFKGRAKRIKDIFADLKLEEITTEELEEELDDAKRDYIPKLEFGLQRANKMGRDAEKENQQLKQQLHDLPNKIVEDIKMQMGSIEDILINCGNGKEDALCWLNRILETTLKKYGGE